MSLFSTVVVNSSNASSSYTAATNAALLANQKTVSTSDKQAVSSTTMSGLQSQTASYPKAITNGVTSTATGVASTVNAAVSTVLGTAGAVVDSVAGLGSSIVSDVFGGSTSGTYARTATNAFSNSASTNSTAAAVKTQTPDPITSSFAKTAPASSVVKLTSATTGLTPHTITGSTTTTSTNDSIVGKISTATQKYGADIVGTTESTLKSATDAVLKNSLVQGLETGLKDVVGVAAAVATTAGTVVNAAETTASSVLTSSLTAFRSIVGNLSTTLTGTTSGLDGGLNSSLPAVTDLNGNAIAGVPTTTSPTVLSSLISTITGLGCSTSLSSSNVASTGALTSVVSLLASLLSGLGITSLLADLMKCTAVSNSTTSSTYQSLFYQYAGSNVGVANTIATGLPAGSLASSPTLLQSIVTNSSLGSSDTTAVLNVLSKLGSTGTSAYSTGTTIGTTPVYNTSTLSNSNTAISSSLLGSDSDLSLMTNGIAI